MNDSFGQNKVRPSGGYRTLHSFRVATVIYDATVSFTERFVDPRSRLVDQMVQAARSGRQMVLRTARQGRNAGSQFLGCSSYPACKGTLEL